MDMESPDMEEGEEEFDRCPKCGGETRNGYGMAGGGCGVYTYCLAEGCDYFDKTQDSEEPP